MAEVKVRASDLKKAKKPVGKPRGHRAYRQPRPPQRPPEPPETDEEEDEEEAEVEVTKPSKSEIDINTWPTRGEAARKVGVNKSTIIRWQKDGELEAVMDTQGFYRFNPDDLDALATNRSSDAAMMMGQSVSMVVATSTDLAGKAQKHAEAFADRHLAQSDIAFSQMQAMTAQIIEENVSLRSYVRELESDRREARKESEEAKGKVHERKLAEMKETVHEKRVDWALSALINLAGPSIAKKMGLGPDAVKAVGELPRASPAEGGVGLQSAPPLAAGLVGHSVPDSEPTGKGVIGVGNPATEGDLVRLETNCILLIGNIEEPRIKILCQVANPNEAEALMEIWQTVQKLRAPKVNRPDEREGKGQG